MSYFHSDLINKHCQTIYVSGDRSEIIKLYEFMRQINLSSESLTKKVQVAISILEYITAFVKNLANRICICKNCKLKCLVATCCEHCIRSYLKAKFSKWTSGNNNVDDLIQRCQMETVIPCMVIEWIPYNNLQNIEYLTSGGFSEIYTADWIDGSYFKWDSKEQQLKRTSMRKVILKRLKNVKSANRSWFEEVCNLKTFNYQLVYSLFFK
jgi:hypothetical protein